jgi:hypothetical protein
MRLLENPSFEDYQIKFDQGNIFAFLGNGYALEELDGSDITYYLGCLDTKVDEASSRDVLKGTAASVKS